MSELDIGPFLQFSGETATHRDLADAIDAASDQDRATWLVQDGRRIAAIVPVGDAEYVFDQGKVL